MQTLEAVYEHGTFRLVQPPTIPLAEGQRVRLMIDTAPAGDDILALAMSIFDGVSPQDISAIDTIIQQRDPFFVR